MNKSERAKLRSMSQMPVVTRRLLDAIDAKDKLISELLQICEDLLAANIDIDTAYHVFDLLKERAEK